MNETAQKTMSTVKVTNREKGMIVRPDIYREFVLWSAMPHVEKMKLGIETQTQFCEFHKIGINTPTAWKQRADFEERVDAILKMWALDKTPDVVHGIYRAAVKGNPMSQMLWLQYFKKFNPKKEDPKDLKKVEIGVNDIRFLIDSLPEPLKSKHHANIRELINDAQQLRHAGQLEDRLREKTAIEADILANTGEDARGLSSQRGDEVAARYTERVCTDLGGTASTYHHQSTARWW